MTDFAKILAELREEQKQLEKRAAQVRTAIDALTSGTTPAGKRKAGKKTAKKRKISAATRAKMAVAQKKRWAKENAKKRSAKSGS